MPQTRHTGSAPGQVPPPGPRLPLGVSRLPRGETQSVRVLLKTWISNSCVLEKTLERQRLQPPQSSWLHLQNRHVHFLQQVLPRCLAWPVHRAAHRHTDGGTRGNSPAQAGREDEAVPLQGWRQAGDAAGVLTGPLGPARTAAPGTPAPCISSRESSRNTRTGVDSCHRPGHVYRKRNTHVSARTRDNTHTYVRK